MPVCTHDNWIMRGEDTAGLVWCNDCGLYIDVVVAFNSLADRMRRAIKEVEDVKAKT